MWVFLLIIAVAIVIFLVFFFLLRDGSNSNDAQNPPVATEQEIAEVQQTLQDFEDGTNSTKQSISDSYEERIGQLPAASDSAFSFEVSLIANACVFAENAACLERLSDLLATGNTHDLTVSVMRSYADVLVASNESADKAYQKLSDYVDKNSLDIDVAALREAPQQGEAVETQ